MSFILNNKIRYGEQVEQREREIETTHTVQFYNANTSNIDVSGNVHLRSVYTSGACLQSTHQIHTQSE